MHVHTYTPSNHVAYLTFSSHILLAKALFLIKKENQAFFMIAGSITQQIQIDQKNGQQFVYQNNTTTKDIITCVSNLKQKGLLFDNSTYLIHDDKPILAFIPLADIDSN